MDIEIKRKMELNISCLTSAFVKDVVIESMEIEDNYETKETQVVVYY